MLLKKTLLHQLKFGGEIVNKNKQYNNTAQINQISVDNGFKKIDEFIFENSVLLLGLLTALLFFSTVILALSRRKFNRWIIYHHLFRQLSN